MNERNESLADRRDLNVEIDNEFLDIIRASSAVSTQMGNSAMLCKIGSKRRRTKAEMDEHKSLQENQFQANLAKDEKIEALERQLTQSKSKLDTAE